MSPFVTQVGIRSAPHFSKNHGILKNLKKKIDSDTLNGKFLKIRMMTQYSATKGKKKAFLLIFISFVSGAVLNWCKTYHRPTNRPHTHTH